MIGRARGLQGGPRMWWSVHLILEAGSLTVATFIYLDPRFSFVCPNETLSCSQCYRGLAMAGLGGQSTMRRRAGLRQGHICAILLSLGKELMRFNGPCALRADLLTPTCPLRLTRFCDEGGTPKFLLEAVAGVAFSMANYLTCFGRPYVEMKDEKSNLAIIRQPLDLEKWQGCKSQILQKEIVFIAENCGCQNMSEYTILLVCLLIQKHIWNICICYLRTSCYPCLKHL